MKVRHEKVSAQFCTIHKQLKTRMQSMPGGSTRMRASSLKMKRLIRPKTNNILYTFDSLTTGITHYSDYSEVESENAQSALEPIIVCCTVLL